MRSGKKITTFTSWPAGLSPQEVGKRVAEHFVTSPHQYGATIHYSEVATWYGGLTFASLTHDDALRTELIHRFEPSYLAMMSALLKYQGKDGMWRQLIDHDEAWPESSSSAMFTFALITGVKNAWLDAKTYGAAPG